jgi:hypothetical protein
MIFTFDIPNAKLQRISNAINMEGYKFDPTSGVTDQNQRLAFFKKMTVQYWQSIVFNYERNEAIKLDPADTAAAQAKRFVDLNDITAS